jgi:ABC-type amino acid transport substrate-binding protein
LEPFAFIDEDGQPSGFSSDLWKAIAADLGIQYEGVPAGTVNELITNLQSGKIDAAIAGISMTPERESLIDLSCPYFESGLQIMVTDNLDAGNVNLPNIFFSSIVFKMLGVALFLLFFIANIFWLMEKRSKSEMPSPMLPACGMDCGGEIVGAGQRLGSGGKNREPAKPSPQKNPET